MYVKFKPLSGPVFTLNIPDPLPPTWEITVPVDIGVTDPPQQVKAAAIPKNRVFKRTQFEHWANYLWWPGYVEQEPSA